MERVDEEGQVATAMTMARMLSATPLSMMGPTKLIIYDIHSLQVSCTIVHCIEHVTFDLFSAA